MPDLAKEFKSQDTCPTMLVGVNDTIMHGYK